MARTGTFLSGLTVGAGLAYFLDPEHGSVRREQLTRRLSPLFGDAYQSLGFNADTFTATGVMRYGSRRGDLPGMGAATLRTSEPRYTSDEAIAAALRLTGVILGFYGLVRRGAIGAVLRTVATGMLARNAGGSGARVGF